MFEPHFGLRENPFSTGHDPRFVYPSPEHLEAVAHFSYGIQNREAFVLVTGEVGTGKTTAIYDLVSRLPQQAHVALINNSALTRIELLEEIARRFGLEPPATSSKPALLGALEFRLSTHNAQGEPCILIVDEAQNLSNDLLEEIRLLSNLEDRGGHLLHICLVGQPELEQKLARPELRQLRQRISVKYRINPLTPEECVRYIHHRLRVAGGEPESIFPEDSAHAVHRMTHGIPREINIVASQAMVNAFVEGQRPVRPEHVTSVRDEFSFQSVLGASDPAAGPEPAPPRTVAPPPAAASPAPSRPVATAVAPPAERPPAAAPGQAPRTVSNWRERRAPAGGSPAPAAASPHLVPQAPKTPRAPAPEPPAPLRGDDGEDMNATRTRLIVGAAIVTVALLVAAVLYSTGMFGQARAPRAATAPAAADSSSATGEVVSSDPLSGTPSAASVPAGGSSYGLQVASFRTSGRAARVLKDLEVTTRVPGEIVPNQGEDGETWFRIVLGRYPNQAEAQRSAQDLIGRSLIAEAIVIPYTPRQR